MPTSPFNDSRPGTSAGCSAWLGVEAITKLIVPAISSNVVAGRPVFVRGRIAAPPFYLKPSYALLSTSVSLDSFLTDGLTSQHLPVPKSMPWDELHETE